MINHRVFIIGRLNCAPCILLYFYLMINHRVFSCMLTFSPESMKHEPMTSKLEKAKKASQLAYKVIVEKKGSLPAKSQEKWMSGCNCTEINWKAAYLLTQQCTNSSRLIEFQFKLLHRRIPTNSFLQKIGLKESSNCSLCGVELETLTNLFWNCNETQCFWSNLWLG